MSAQIFPSSAGAGIDVGMIDINLQSTMNKFDIAEILMWMKDSKYMGKAENQMVLGGGSPASLTLKLINGDKIMIMDAVTSVSIKYDKGIAIKGISIRDQVTLYMNNKSIRIYSPELKDWITSRLRDYE